MESNTFPALLPIPLDELIDRICTAVLAKQAEARDREIKEKLLTPDEARKLFDPVIGKNTLANWDHKGLIKSQRIGSRRYYKYSDIVEAGTRLKKYKR